MTCPINGDTHKYFLFKTYDIYESVTRDPELKFTDGGIQRYVEYLGAIDLYKKVEYGVLGCNCGSVIKSRIKDSAAAMQGREQS